MKRLFLITVGLIMATHWCLAQDAGKRGMAFGILYMAGGRYDDVRMCVATDGGVKGGPIADVMFLAKFSFSPKSALTFNLPVMRPLLFGLAFQMLQSEPEITYQYRKVITENKSMITGPGLGVSLNYGPDFKSDLKNRGDAFFAAGPIISWQIGLEYNKNQKTSSIGIRVFYIPLIAKKHQDGTVLGLALEYVKYF